MKEVTYEEWQKNPTPRMMWVWSDDFEKREKKKVVYVIKDDFASCPVLAVSEEDSSFCVYCHCAEIEESKTRRMTNQELAWWLQDGIKDGKHREIKYGCKQDDVEVECQYTYLDGKCNGAIPVGFLIRENDGEWREPLVEVEE